MNQMAENTAVRLAVASDESVLPGFQLELGWK